MHKWLGDTVLHIPIDGFPDSKVHGANMGPTWVLSAPDEPHVGLMNLAIWVGQSWPSGHIICGPRSVGITGMPDL